MNPLKPGKYSYDDLDICFLYEPFYIGKGSNNRINRHTHKDCLRKDTNQLKKNKILKILKENKEIIKVKLREKLYEEESLLIEEEFIKKIGRRDIKTGELCNMSNGGEKGYLQNQEKRKKGIVQYTLGGDEIKTFKSIKDAAELLNISKACISLCCNRKIHTYKGCIWRFKNDNSIVYDEGMSKGNKKIVQLINGEKIIYESIKEFCQKNNKHVSNIVEVLKGRRNNIYKIYYL